MQSTIVGNRANDEFVVHYSIEVDACWRVSNVRADVSGRECSIDLHRSEEDRWFDGSNNELESLRGCLDVDLAITPATNSLAIRRLQLEIGQSAEILAAYIEFPSLAVSTDLQRYTRLSAQQYRYESMDSDFVRDISVDSDGFVLTYPGMFERV